MDVIEAQLARKIIKDFEKAYDLFCEANDYTDTPPTRLAFFSCAQAVMASTHLPLVSGIVENEVMLYLSSKYRQSMTDLFGQVNTSVQETVDPTGVQTALNDIKKYSIPEWNSDV